MTAEITRTEKGYLATFDRKLSHDIEKVWQATESCDTKIPNEFEDPVTYDYKVLIVPRTILHIPLAHIEFRCGGTSYEGL